MDDPTGGNLPWLMVDIGKPALSGDGPHTYHPNTFGLLYGKTTKTACSKRVATERLVSPLDATCTECQTVIIDAMTATQEAHNVALDWAKAEGYKTIREWSEANKLKLGERYGLG